MPHYYFDIEDGDRYVRDEDGQDMPDLDAARDEAIGVLPDVARAKWPDGDHGEIVAKVRDESGRTVFKATLSLTTEWLLAR